ncbi:unnamed protein product, partial [Rotaria sp. Silwood2]
EKELRHIDSPCMDTDDRVRMIRGKPFQLHYVTIFICTVGSLQVEFRLRADEYWCSNVSGLNEGTSDNNNFDNDFKNKST